MTKQSNSKLANFGYALILLLFSALLIVGPTIGVYKLDYEAAHGVDAETVAITRLPTMADIHEAWTIENGMARGWSEERWQKYKLSRFFSIGFICLAISSSGILILSTFTRTAQESQDGNTTKQLIESLDDNTCTAIAELCSKGKDGPKVADVKALCEESNMDSYNVRNYLKYGDRSSSTKAALQRLIETAERLLMEIRLQSSLTEPLPVSGAWDSAENKRLLGAAEGAVKFVHEDYENALGRYLTKVSRQ